MNEHKFHTGKVMRSTPGQRGKGTKTNRKHVLLRELAKQKYEEFERMKKNGEVKEGIPNELEHWLYIYSDFTIDRLKNELLKLDRNPTQ